MLKHVGTHKDQKVAIIFREVPGEDHMCLVCYSDQLPNTMHNDLMNAIQSNAAQSEHTLADALTRVTGSNGVNILEDIHKHGWMKKIQTSDVIIKPNAKSDGVQLGEINEIIKKIEEGGEAATKLATLDASAGVQLPEKVTNDTTAINEALKVTSDVLSDSDIASNMLSQVEQLTSQINALHEEVTRLQTEAYSLDPSLKPKTRKPRAKKKTKTAVNA